MSTSWEGAQARVGIRGKLIVKGSVLARPVDRAPPVGPWTTMDQDACVTDVEGDDQGAFGPPVRLVLTALAVLLGVSFVSATYVLTDTVKRSFDAVFAQTVAGVDLLVGGSRTLGTPATRRASPRATLDQVRAVPGVERAEGYVTGYAQFVGRDGESIGGGGPPTFGVSWVKGGPFRLVDDGVSRPPRTSREVAMDVGTARRTASRWATGSACCCAGRRSSSSIVGIFGFGDRDRLRERHVRRVRPRDRAATSFEADGALDRIYVQTRSRRAASAVLRAARARARARLRRAHAVEADERIGQPVPQFLGYFTYALLGFAAIGVVVGAFIIFNTFAILVAQRTRELGLARARWAPPATRSCGRSCSRRSSSGAWRRRSGPGRRDLPRDRAARARCGGIGLELPETSTVLLGRTVVVSLARRRARHRRRRGAAGGAGGPGAAGRGDQRRPSPVAGRLPPTARRRARRHRGGVGVLAYGLVRAENVTGLVDQVQVVALGAFSVLVGVVVLLATVARPLAASAGGRCAVLGMTGSLARANAMRNPRRTAITASALVIGLALVGLTATFGASAKASVARDTGAGLRADYVVKSDGFAGFSNEVATRLRRSPSSTRSCRSASPRAPSTTTIPRLVETPAVTSRRSGESIPPA